MYAMGDCKSQRSRVTNKRECDDEAPRLGSSAAHCMKKHPDCLVAHLFKRSDTNPEQLRLGTLDSLGVHVRALVNRTDQGWARPILNECVAT